MCGGSHTRGVGWGVGFDKGGSFSFSKAAHPWGEAKDLISHETGMRTGRALLSPVRHHGLQGRGAEALQGEQPSSCLQRRDTVSAPPTTIY